MTVATIDRTQQQPPLVASLAQLRAHVETEPLVFDGVCPDLIPELREEILELARRYQSERSLNRGGWKSPETFFQIAGPAAAELERFLVVEILGGRRPIGWAMINAGGSEHPRHQHMLASVVGVYYVAAGDPIVPTIYECGTPPRTAELAKKWRGVDMPIEPEPGRLVISSGPSWHRVPRYEGTEPRITIAFDVRR